MSNRHIWVKGSSKDQRDPAAKCVEQQPAQASHGCLSPCRGGMNRHSQKLGRLKGLTTPVSYFLMLFPQRALPRPGNKSGQEPVPASVLMLQWKHNRCRENTLTAPLRTNQNILRITDVQRQLRHLGTQFWSSWHLGSNGSLFGIWQKQWAFFPEKKNVHMHKATTLQTVLKGSQDPWSSVGHEQKTSNQPPPTHSDPIINWGSWVPNG